MYESTVEASISRVLPVEARADPELVEEGEHGVHVFDAGDVVEDGLPRREERRRDELQGGILGP